MSYWNEKLRESDGRDNHYLLNIEKIDDAEKNQKITVRASDIDSLKNAVGVQLDITIDKMVYYDEEFDAWVWLDNFK